MSLIKHGSFPRPTQLLHSSHSHVLLLVSASSWSNIVACVSTSATICDHERQAFVRAFEYSVHVKSGSCAEATVHFFCCAGRTLTLQPDHSIMYTVIQIAAPPQLAQLQRTGNTLPFVNKQSACCRFNVRWAQQENCAFSSIGQSSLHLQQHCLCTLRTRKCQLTTLFHATQ